MSTEEVRRELHAALDLIDVPAPDAGALLARAQSRGGPPRAAWVLLAACVVIVGVAATFVVNGPGGRDVAAEPDDFVPATSQALAALAIERLDLDPEIQAMEMDDVDGVFGALIWTEPAARPNLGPGLMLGIEDDPEEDICDEFGDNCVTLASSRGDVTLVWAADEGDPDAPDEADDPFLGLTMYGVAWRDPITDDFEAVFHQGAAFAGDPRDADVPVSVDDLVGLLTDERLGRMTDQELVDREVPGWTDVPDFGNDDFDPDEFEEEGGRMSGFDETENPFVGDTGAMIELHLGVTPKKVNGFAAGGQFAGVDIRLPGKPPHDLYVQVSTDDKFGPLAPPCKADPTLECVTWEVQAGTVTISWLGEESADDLGLLQVALAEADEWQMASIFFDDTEIRSDPRELDLPVSVDQLVALLSDPGVTLR